jgi:sugar lactone lactonase YvrE
MRTTVVVAMCLLQVSCAAFLRDDWTLGSSDGEAAVEAAAIEPARTAFVAQASTDAATVAPDAALSDAVMADAPSTAEFTICDEGSVACAGSCVDLEVDPKNCGRCAHDCQGGACANGRCEAVALASGQGSPNSVAVDATHAYWSNTAGMIMECPIDGCGGNPTVLATGQTAVTAIAAVAGQVYWITSAAVMTCPAAGCGNAPTVMAAEQSSPSGIALDTASVYWSNQGTSGANGTIVQCPLAGCGTAPNVLGIGQAYPRAIAVGAGHLYWADYNRATVMNCTSAGCQADATVLISGQASPYGVAVDSANVYWTNGGATVMKCPLTGCASAATLTSAQANVSGIASDGVNVYWTEFGNGSVMRCPVDGCAGGPTVVSAGMGGQATGIALDAACVYWANYGGGTVMKIAK